MRLHYKLHEAKPSLIIAVISRGAAECNNWCNRIINAVRFANNSTILVEILSVITPPE